MVDEKLQRAKKVYENLCTAMEKRGWPFNRNDEMLSIQCGAQGDDLPMEIKVIIDAEKELIMLLSRLPFVVPEDKRFDVAVAASVTNDRLVDGSFDFDISNGRMFFRLTSSFIESEIGEELFVYMIMVSCKTIDDFNDKFFMLEKGMLSLENFISECI